jgi:hypothetical protein
VSSRLEGSNPSLSAFLTNLQAKRSRIGGFGVAPEPLYCNPSAESFVDRICQAVIHAGQHVAVSVNCLLLHRVRAYPTLVEIAS